MKIRRVLAIILVCAFLLTGCSLQSGDKVSEKQDSTEKTSNVISEISDVVTEAVVDDWKPKETEYVLADFDSDDSLRYIEDNVYNNLVSELDSDEYFVENVQSVYMSQEYIDEVLYNSQENIFFGYKLSELNELYQGKRYIFTLDDNNNTVVKEFEGYDDTYDRVIQNVAIGTGVILICVTVSLVSGGVGAPAVSVIFATAAKSAAIAGASSGAIGAAAAGLTTGIATGNMDEAIKQAALNGSEEFKWGAIVGAITGGASEAISLFGATFSGLTMNEAAFIQKQTKWPIKLIKKIHSLEEFNIYKEASLVPQKINGNWALVRKINWKLVDSDGLSNIVRVQNGLSPIDIDGVALELHHIGQKPDSPLAILTWEEHHRKGNYKILHYAEKGKGMSESEWAKQKMEFWNSLLQSALEAGL